jgi:PAS domain S-box-containing protein
MRRELEDERCYERSLFEASADAMVIVDEAGIIRRANAATARTFGYDQAELVGRPVEMLLPTRYRRRHAERRVLFSARPHARGMAAGLELAGLRKDGVELSLEIRLTPHQSATGLLVTAEIRDVTERKRIEADLDASRREAAESLTLLETLQSTAPVGFGFVDRDFRIRNFNARLAAIRGGRPQDMIGRTVAEAVPHLWPQIGPAYRRVIETGEPVINVSVEGEDASSPGVRSWLTSLYPVRVDGEMIGIGQIVVDVTESRRSADLRAAVMQNMAEGLFVMDGEGRLVLMNAAASSMLGWSEDELVGKPVHKAIHYVHADGSGYPEEDCQLMKLRSEGEGAAGDDAFVAKDGRIIPVAYSASRLFDGSSEHSVVVVFHDTTEQHAERARARRALDELTWVGRIRDALDENRLVLYAQPIIPLRGGIPRSELLLRMIGRNGQIILPGTFLPAAEKHGLIGDIDRWVITQAIALAAGGQTVQANISAHSIADRGLLADIERQIHERGVDPAHLVFELTETALMHDIDTGERFAHRLTALGCAVALDDFGTGFGTFTYLQRLPITYLKIDHDFVRDLPTNAANQHLVKAIVSLAQGFEQQTIAEGVADAQHSSSYATTASTTPRASTSDDPLQSTSRPPEIGWLSTIPRAPKPTRTAPHGVRRLSGAKSRCR